MSDSPDKFYCRDARELFLEKESVDLFITHPPYYRVNMDAYGDPKDQLHNVDAIEDYEKNLTAVLAHMKYAIKPTGNIFLVMPNNNIVLNLIHKVVRDSGLVISKRSYIWSIVGEQYRPEGVSEFCYIFHIVPSEDAIKTHYTNDGYELSSRIIESPWETSAEITKYEDIAHVYDSLPQEIPKVLISKFSKPDDVVGDLLAGTGSICLVAKKLGRSYVYNDVSELQLKVAKNVLNDFANSRLLVSD